MPFSAHKAQTLRPSLHLAPLLRSSSPLIAELRSCAVLYISTATSAGEGHTGAEKEH